MENVVAKGDYFGMNSQNMLIKDLTLYGDYSFDGVKNLEIYNSKLISKDASNAYAFYYRGMINDALEKRTEAIADYKKAYALNSTDFEIINYLIAVDYDTLGNTKEAYNYYNLYANSNAADDEYKQYAKARAEELNANK